MDDHVQDICRVCRCESQPDKVLYHPCICMGSIKWIHQECLMQWMRYSRKNYCELCGHNFSFEPIYAPDMPKVLPISVIAKGILCTFGSALKCWFHYSLIACMWLGIMPFCAYRTYKFFFYGSADMKLASPLQLLTIESLANDILRGGFVVTCTLIAFIGLVWLREQIIHGGGPDWLQLPDAAAERNNFRLDLPLRRAPPIPFPNLGDERLEDYLNRLDDNQANEENDDVIISDREDIDDIEDVNRSNQDEGSSRFYGGDSRSNNLNIDDNDIDDEHIFAQRTNSNLDSNSSSIDSGKQNESRVGNVNSIHSSDSGSDRNINNTENNTNNHANYRNDNENNTDNENHSENEIIRHDNDNNQINNINNHLNNLNLNFNNEEPAFNPLEWERAAEDLTWERLLGLDGSMIFIEHVFWVVLLNVIFIFIFAFLPFSIGNILVAIINSLYPHKILDNIHGFVAVLVGYLVVSVVLIEMYALADICGLRRLQRNFGLCYIVIKVALLSVIEIGILPLLCGWWLDVCSLSLFDSTMEHRKNTFRKAFGTLTYLYWMFGMVYVYYFASFIVLLREILRPEALWFLRNFNDPDFSPIQEMIHLPTARHIKRLITSSIIFGSAVLLLVWLPIRILSSLWPTFLPYSLNEDWETYGLGMPLLLLRLLPGFLEQYHIRSWIKVIVKYWCNTASWLIGLDGCLLSNSNTSNSNDEAANEEPVKQAENATTSKSSADNENYVKPKWFRIRLIALLILAGLTFVLSSSITLTVPIWIGRSSIAVIKQIIKSFGVNNNDILSQPHELYTSTIGIYMCCLAVRSMTLCFNFMSESGTSIVGKINSFISLAVQHTISGSILMLLLAVIPLLYGLLLEEIIVLPLRVPLDQTPVVFLWQDWILGILYTKITCVLILMGPDSHAKHVLEQCCHNGFRELDVRFIFTDLAIPAIMILGLALTIPYVLAYSIIPLFCYHNSYRILITRRIYPTSLVLVIVIFIVSILIKQFKKTCATIKNNRYLIGQQLVNYCHNLERKSK